MAKIDDFREGAVSGDPADKCPACGVAAPLLRFDFRKMGAHRLVVCAACKAVSVDGALATKLIVFPPPVTRTTG